MKSFLVFLSVLLVFAGIAIVLYVNIPAVSIKKEQPHVRNTQTLCKEFVVRKHSMREIDSITAATNFLFTIENAVAFSGLKRSGNSSAVTIIK